MLCNTSLDRGALFHLQQSQQVPLDGCRDVTERQVAQVGFRERVLEFDANLVERYERVGDHHGNERDQPVAIDAMQQKQTATSAKIEL